MTESNQQSPADEAKELTHCVAQLRHLYSHLVNGTFVEAKRIADGILAPEIRRLEKMLHREETDADERRMV